MRLIMALLSRAADSRAISRASRPATIGSGNAASDAPGHEVGAEERQFPHHRAVDTRSASSW